jgi:hypothetical protein
MPKHLSSILTLRAAAARKPEGPSAFAPMRFRLNDLIGRAVN